MKQKNSNTDFYRNRHIRVFLSSTFADMQAERDMLVKKTFPALKRLCQRRNVDFSVVDLRWGVTEEEAQTGRVIEICLDEIERTRPFFIGLIGGRYGWTPTANDLELNPRLVNRYPWVKNCVAQQMSITEMEIQYGVLKSELPIHAQFFIRQDKKTPAQHQEQKDSLGAQKLNQLKQTLHEHAEQGRCQLSRYGSPKDLAKKVYQQFTTLINELYPEKEVDPVAIMQETQQARMLNFQKVYQNKGMLDMLEAQVMDLESCQSEDTHKGKARKTKKGKWCLIINEAKGFGKSALLANWRKGQSNVIRTFLDNKVNTAALALEHLNASKKASGIKSKSGLIWVVDGLEHLASEEERTLEWMENIDANLIVSTNNGLFEHCASSMAKHSGRQYAKVHMAAPTTSEIIGISKQYLKQFAKGLSEKQFLHIANQQLFANIKLLRIFLDEVIQFGVYEQLDAFMNSYLQVNNATEMLERVLDRLENDYGENVVRQFFGMLCTTKLGVPEEMLQRQTDLNNIDWAAFYSSVEQFVTPIDGLVRLDEQELHTIASERYLSDEKQVHRWRGNLISSYQKTLRRFLSTRKWGEALLYDPTCWLAGFSKAISLDHTLVRPYQNIEAEILLQRLQDGQNDYVQKHYSILRLCFMMSGDNAREVLFALDAYDSQRAARSIGYTTILTIYLTGTSSEMMNAIFALLGNDKESMNIVRKRIRSMWLLPKKVKKGMIEAIDNAVGTSEDETPMEDTWESISLEKLNIGKASEFLTFNLPFIISETRIRHIAEKADLMLNRMKIAEDNDEDINKGIIAIFQCIKALCLCRMGDIKEADDLYSQALQHLAAISQYLFLPHFLIANALGDWNRCNDCIQRALNTNGDYLKATINARREALLMQMALTCDNGDEQRFESLLHQLAHLYDEQTDMPDRDDFQHASMNNGVCWLIGLKHYRHAARICEVAVTLPSLPKQKHIEYYSLACDAYKKASMPNEAIQAGIQALSLHKEMVERGEAKPSATYYDDLQAIYQEVGDYCRQRQVLQQLKHVYEQRQENGNRLWAIGRIAYSFIEEARKTIIRSEANHLYEQGFALYEEVCQQDSLEQSGVSYYIRRYNRDYNIAHSIVFKGYRVNDAAQVQHIAQDMMELKQIAEDNQEVSDVLGDVIGPLCMCLAATGRYEEMEPYLSHLSIDLKNLYYIHTSESEEPINSYFYYQIPKYMEYWNQDELERSLPLTLYDVVQWEHPQYEDFMIPRMEQMAGDKESPIRAQVMASLMIHYHIMEESEKLNAMRDEAQRLIDEDMLDDKETYTLLLALELLSSGDEHQPVDDETMLRLMNDADSGYAKFRNAEHAISAVRQLYDNEEFWKGDDNQVALVRQAIDAFRFLGEDVDGNCYLFLMLHHQNHCDWQDILNIWDEVKESGLKQTKAFQLQLAQALFYLSRYDEAINQYNQLLKEGNQLDRVGFMIAYIEDLFRAGYTDKARTILQKCEAEQRKSQLRDKSFDLFYYWAAYIMAESGRHAEALQYLEKDMMVAKGDKEAMTHNKLVRVFCYIEQGNIQDAMRLLSALPQEEVCKESYLFNMIMVELAFIRHHSAHKNVSEVRQHYDTLSMLVERYGKRAGILQKRLSDIDRLIGNLPQA